MDELAGLTEEARKLTMERFRLLQPHLERNEPLTSVARDAGIPYRTAHRLVSGYRRIGLAALVRKQRVDRGERRVVSTKLKEKASLCKNRRYRLRHCTGRCRGSPRSLARRPRATVPFSTSFVACQPTGYTRE